MHRLGLLRWIALGLLVSGCSASRTDRPSPAVAATTDKAALFGDPSLVPTRRGERAREELGQADAITRALTVLPPVQQAHVDVELPDRAKRGPPRVLAVIRVDHGSDRAALQDRAERIASTVAGPDATIEALVVPGETAPVDPAAPTPWPLLLGVLGLGYFAGMLVERARRVRRPGARRRAR
ncbi:MAG: hypothetical protein AAGF11_40190 [Myxococcota bacterium]